MFERSVGKKPVPVIASSRTSTGGSTGVKPCCRGGRGRRGRARMRGARCRRSGSRSGSRRAARRAPCRSGRPPCARAARSSCGGSPEREISTASSSSVPSGDDSCGGFGTCASASSRAVSAAASSSSAARRSSFTCCSSASCSGEGLPFSFVFPRSSSTFGTSARQRSSASSSGVEGLAGALPCQRRAVGVRVVAGGLEVDHGVKSRKASIACATPCSSAGAKPVGPRLQHLVPRSRRDAEARPPEQLEVVLAVAEGDRPRRGEAEMLRHEPEPASLRDRAGWPARGSTAATWRCRDGRRTAPPGGAGTRRGAPGRRRRRASSAAARSTPGGRRPRDREALEIGVGARAR